MKKFWKELMTFETKSKIEFVAVVIGILALFSLPLVVMSVGI
jgi:hypothetical protein